MKISLILATLSRVDEVARFLDSVARADDAASIELVVVDQNTDGRLDSVVQAIRSSSIGIKHVKAPKNGLSFARNVGLAECTGNIVGFPDDDCWYEDSTAAEVLAWFQASPECAMGYAAWPESADAGQMPTISRIQARRFQVGVPSSIQLFFRTDLLRRLGGFDERIGLGRFYGAGEETDLCLRALEVEPQLRPIPNASVHHRFERKSTKSAYGAIDLASRQRGTGALYAKHSLEAWVIARGIVAPVTQTLFSWKSFGQGVTISKARAEGMRSWRQGKER
jgi:glycosyltransferase involved in cell wall biosynthesis